MLGSSAGLANLSAPLVAATNCPKSTRSFGGLATARAVQQHRQAPAPDSCGQHRKEKHVLVHLRFRAKLPSVEDPAIWSVSLGCSMGYCQMTGRGPGKLVCGGMSGKGKPKGDISLKHTNVTGLDVRGADIASPRRGGLSDFDSLLGYIIPACIAAKSPHSTQGFFPSASPPLTPLLICQIRSMWRALVQIVSPPVPSHLKPDFRVGISGFHLSNKERPSPCNLIPHPSPQPTQTRSRST